MPNQSEGNKKALVYVIDKLEYGGAQTGMVRLLKRLNKKYDIKVITFYTENNELKSKIPDHIDVIDLKIENYYGSYRSIRLIKEIKNADIIVGSLWHSTVIGTIVGKLSNKKVITWIHNTQYGFMKKWTYVLLYIIADKVVADSRAAQKSFNNNFISEKKIKIVPIAGIDTQKYKKDIKRNRGDKINVLTIGKISEQKNYQAVINCATQLENINFNIIGLGGRKELEKVVENRIPDNVNIKQNLSEEELIKELTRSDIYFQPSKREGLCITVLEAMSCELPVVASSVGGIKDSVIHGKTGYKTKPSSLEDFCRYISVLAKDKEKRNDFGKEGRKRVKNKYSGEVLKTEFEKVLEDI